MVLDILNNSESLTHDGPLGGTKLHAAVISNDNVTEAGSLGLERRDLRDSHPSAIARVLHECNSSILSHRFNLMA